GSVFIDGTTSVITVTPANGFSGDIDVPYAIADQDGATDTAVHTVRVVEGPPVIFQDPEPMSSPLGEVPESNTDIDVGGIIINTVRNIGDVGLYAVDLSEEGIVLDTVNSLSQLGGLGSASFGEFSIGKTINDIGRLQDLRDSSERAFPGRFSGLDVQALVGFSVRMDVDGVGAVGDSTRSGQIIVDTLKRDEIIYVEIGNSLNLDGDRRVTGYSVVQADGSPLPEWVHQADEGLLLAEAPVSGGELSLKISASTSDGTTVTRSVTLQLATGEVQELAEKGANAAKTFQQQLQEAGGGR
ncbi:MAG: hypothetical protein AAFV45_09650, partial [Pseudomonadota bacterium]